MEKQKAYSTHEIVKVKKTSYYFLREIGMALQRYATHFLLRKNLNFNYLSYLSLVFLIFFSHARLP